MPFDGIALYAAINEIKSQILGHTINKIYQPKNDQLIISFRHGIEEKFLLVSANPNNCRIHLADNLPDNPSTPPMFCMLLRKNLLGGKLTNVNQLGLERVVEFTVQNKNEFMKQVEYKLLVEIMGKHSNIILVDNSTNRIIDCIKRITSDVNRYRQILPNRQYVFPPIGEKCNFLLIDKKHILSLILPAIKANTQKNISSWILENIMGLSGRTAKEIVKRADVEDVQIGFISNDKLYKVIDALADLREQVKANSFFPTIYYEPKSLEPVDFWVFPMSLRDGYIAKISDSVNKAVDRYYFLKEQADALKSRNTSLTLQISKFIEKKSKNIYLIKTRLSETDEMNKYKLWGEILSAYLYLIKPGVNKVKLANFYEPGHDIEIPLNKKMTPAQNAQHYFNKYKKLQSAKAIIKKRLKKMQQEMEYLESVLVNAQNCSTLDDIIEIQQELIEQGYLKKKKIKTPKKNTAQPLQFKSHDGFTIYVGKNNRQNDILTKRAKPEDIWLHTKNLPGSHVIIECHGKTISDSTLEEAGCLAAYFSKARDGNKVPVDYTFAKNVRKPVGAKPGFVIYDNYKTIFVNPKCSQTENLPF